MNCFYASFGGFYLTLVKTDSAKETQEQQTGTSSSLSARVKARVDPLPLQNVLPSSGGFVSGSNQSSVWASWLPGSIFSPGWVNYGVIPENAFAFSPSVFVETPTKHLNLNNEGILVDIASTQVSTPNSLTGTPHYLQQQDEGYIYSEQTGENTNSNREDGNENPINTLAAISESRLPFQTQQAPNDATLAVHSEAQLNNEVDLNISNANGEATSIPGSKRWYRESNQSICTVSERVGKKPRPRGYSVKGSNEMQFRETPSLSKHSNIPKTEPLFMNSKERNNHNLIPSFFVRGSSMANSTCFTLANGNIESSLRNRGRRDNVVEDNSKLSLANYSNPDALSQQQSVHYPFRMTETNACSVQSSYLRRQSNECLQDTTSLLDRGSLTSLPAETPSQRRERRKLARAQVRAAHQLQKRQAMERLRNAEAQKLRIGDNTQHSTVSPEEFSFASSRQEDVLQEDAKDTLDPKVFRAIRNREAALRSRQQAKARLKALETENAEFQQRLHLLERENMELRQELNKFKAFLQNKVPLEHNETSCRATEQP